MFRRIAQFFCNPIASRIRLADWLRARNTRALENEVARLRAENRALVNSILGIAGIPPMGVAAATCSATAMAPAGATLRSPGRGKPRPYEGAVATQQINMAASEDADASHEVRDVAPLRRRSWQQIGRAMALADARAAQRERESDTETFPAPRRTVPRL